MYVCKYMYDFDIYIYISAPTLSLPSLFTFALSYIGRLSLSLSFKAYLSQLYKLTDVTFLSSFFFSIAIVDRAFPILATDSRCVLQETKSNAARYDPPVCHHRVLNNKISFFYTYFLTARHMLRKSGTGNFIVFKIRF